MSCETMQVRPLAGSIGAEVLGVDLRNGGDDSTWAELTVWDNRCTLHNAINDYHGQRRHMRRLTVGAELPA